MLQVAEAGGPFKHAVHVQRKLVAEVVVEQAHHVSSDADSRMDEMRTLVHNNAFSCASHIHCVWTTGNGLFANVVSLDDV